MSKGEVTLDEGSTQEKTASQQLESILQAIDHEDGDRSISDIEESEASVESDGLSYFENRMILE